MYLFGGQHLVLDHGKAEKYLYNINMRYKDLSKVDRRWAPKGAEEGWYRNLFWRYKKTENFISAPINGNLIVPQKGYYKAVKDKIPRKIAEIK